MGLSIVNNKILQNTYFHAASTGAHADVSVNKGWRLLHISKLGKMETLPMKPEFIRGGMNCLSTHLEETSGETLDYSFSTNLGRKSICT